jgi:acetyl-CoA C-acetyltransferase
LIADNLNLRKEISATKVEGACSSGAIALRQGYLLIASGVYDIVLVGGVEKMTSASREKITASMSSSMDMDTDGQSGMTFPGFWALLARAHMHEYGTTIEQIGLVSVKNHNNSMLNPRARFRNRVTLEEVLKSKPVCDPLKIYDCCPIADGAAAAVLCAAEMAKDYSAKPVEIIASVQTSGHSTLSAYQGLTALPPTQLAARKAFEMARMEPTDIDVVELHDCFSPAEIVDSQDLGFFEKGKGGPAVQEGITQVGGKIPINPSGGLLAKGHPTGATGLGQTYEIVKQLRGEHENQVKGAEIGLVHNAGGPASVNTVHILKRR